MGWARFDDGYSESEKVIAAGPWAELLDMRAIIYCARNETDGKVSRDALKRIGVGIPNVLARVDKLLVVGRWANTESGLGWVVHDFLKYHLSKAQREAQREKWRTKKEIQRMSPGDSSESPPKGRELVGACAMCDEHGWRLSPDGVPLLPVVVCSHAPSLTVVGEVGE